MQNSMEIKFLSDTESEGLKPIGESLLKKVEQSEEEEVIDDSKDEENDEEKEKD